mgnify:CR=1 FL=1
MKRLTLQTNTADVTSLNVLMSEASQKKIISEIRKSKVLNDLLFLDSVYLKENKDIRVLTEEMSTAMADLAVEENLPAEKEEVSRNHLLTLIQAGVAPVAAYRVIKNIIKGEFLEAFKNLPGINLFLVPEAIYELIMSGLSALPENIRKDLVENKYSKAMLRLLFSMKELQKSEDISQFYDNLKSLINESSHALIIFSGFLASLAAVCAAKGAAIVTTGVAVLAAIEAATVGLASPVVAAGLGVALSVLVAWETVCAVLAAGAVGSATAGFVSFLINKVSKMDPEADVFRDEKFQKEVMNLVQGMSEEHSKKLKEKQSQMNVSYDQAEPLEFDSAEEDKEDLLSDPVTVPYNPGMSTPEEDLRLVAENKTYKRWQALSGIK